MSNKNDQYLAHYGVLGMRWGVKRAAKKSGAYSKTNQQTKQKIKEIKKTKGVSRAEKKQMIKKAKENLKKQRKEIDIKVANKQYSKNSAEANKRIMSLSSGEALAQTWLLTGYGAVNYNRTKAAGYSSGVAITSGVLSAIGNTFLGGYPSIAAYMNNREARK